MDGFEKSAYRKKKTKQNAKDELFFQIYIA